MVPEGGRLGPPGAETERSRGRRTSERHATDERWTSCTLTTLFHRFRTLPLSVLVRVRVIAPFSIHRDTHANRLPCPLCLYLLYRPRHPYVRCRRTAPGRTMPRPVTLLCQPWPTQDHPSSSIYPRLLRLRPCLFAV